LLTQIRFSIVAIVCKIAYLIEIGYFPLFVSRKCLIYDLLRISRHRFNNFKCQLTGLTSFDRRLLKSNKQRTNSTNTTLTTSWPSMSYSISFTIQAKFLKVSKLKRSSRLSNFTTWMVAENWTAILLLKFYWNITSTVASQEDQLRKILMLFTPRYFLNMYRWWT